MIALDSDILTLMMQGNTLIASKVATIDARNVALPIVVIEEVMRGRLVTIRRAQAGQTRMGITHAYDLFENSLTACMQFPVLSYTPAAENLFNQWRAARIRVPTQDLRIAAICASENISLATRNIRDFSLIPNLTLETWN